MNVPLNMKEFKHLDGWECSISTTALDMSPTLLRLALGAADIDGTNTNKVVPRSTLIQSDFGTLWWVGDKADGGYVAVKLMYALSTDGLSIQTNKNSKGEMALTLTGHTSINDQDTVPMEFYSSGPSDADSTDLATLTVTTTDSATLSPTFSASVLNYTLSTTAASATITATAKTAATAAVVTIRNGNTTVASGGAATLALGTNVITITVVNNGVSKTYTITITRTAGA